MLRPDVPLGSKADLTAPKSDFRSTPKSGPQLARAGSPFRAMDGSVEYLLRKQKAARRRLLSSNLMIVDQTAINAGFDFPR
jgi:hypothetical protein